MSKSFLKLGVNVGLIFVAIFVVHFVVRDTRGGQETGNTFKQDSKTEAGNWDLATTLGRELASREKPISDFTVKKCGEIAHTDGDILTICLAKFHGTSGGFYDASKSLMVVGSFNEYTLVHEVFHAASIHNYKKGYTDMMSAETQEKMAYDAESLLMQIHAFQEDFSITPDLIRVKKEKLGLPIEEKLAKN